MQVRIPRVSAARVASAVFAVVLLTVEGVIAAESWRGLVGFAGLIDIHGVAGYGVPVTLDGVSLAASLLALWAELDGESSAPYRATMFLATGVSAAANWWHGEKAGGILAALYFGAMSLAVTWMFALVLRHIRRSARRREGRMTERLPRFSAAHWGRYPRTTFRAWSLAIAHGYETAREALEAAQPDAELPEVPPNGVLVSMPKADAIRLALAHNDGNVLDAQRWLAERGVSADRAYMHDVKRGVSGRRRGRRELPAGGAESAA